MIRKLTQKDNEQIMEYLKKESAYNLFIIGDIENFGYDTDYQTLWAEFINDEITGVLLKYYNYYVFYSHKNNFNVEGFSEIITSDENFEILSGKEQLIEQFYTTIADTTPRVTYFAELTKLNTPIKVTEKIKKATLEEVDQILNLRASIEEFTNEASKESLIENLKSNSSEIFYIEKDGQIISTAQTTAENSESAMIVGVCTHKNYRKKGYASQCMIKLCEELLNRNKTLCLFYDNPAAGKIYKRIGFHTIGKWTMLEKK